MAGDAEPVPEGEATVTTRLVFDFYGDRAGRLRDPFGHQWMLSTHIEDVDRDEIDRRMQAWSEQQG